MSGHDSPPGTNVDALAQALWAARTDGHVVAVPDPVPTLDEAYAVQATIATLSGSTIAGWKIGSTSPEAQARLGTDEPGAGPVMARFLHHGDTEVAVHPAHAVCVEAEFAFELGADLGPAAPVREALVGVVRAVRPAIEIVGSRFAGGLDGLGRNLVTADGGANVALVVGPRVTDWRGMDLTAQPVSLSIDGRVRAKGTGAHAFGNPMNVLLWFAGHCQRRGIIPRAGQIVSTGTCTGLVAIAPGALVSADFGPLGRVSFRVVSV